MSVYPSHYELIPVTELNVGDTVCFHGARFLVHTAAMYKDHGPIEHGPVMTALASWIEGETVPGYFGPSKDWNFQGNMLHKVRRELAPPAIQPERIMLNPVDPQNRARRVRHGQRPTEPLVFEDNPERDKLLAALDQIERLARKGTREGHIIRDAIQEIASKALAPHRVGGVLL